MEFLEYLWAELSRNNDPVSEKDAAINENESLPLVKKSCNFQVRDELPRFGPSIHDIAGDLTENFAAFGGPFDVAKFHW